MPSGVSVPLTIQVFKGQTLVRTETLTQDIIKIGKLTSSHLQLDDESVSRMHAVIEVSPAKDVTVVDLGSTKGTFVNGNRVNKAKLSSGDEVLIGDVRLVITMDEVAEVTGAIEIPDVVRPMTGPRPTSMGLPLPQQGPPPIAPPVAVQKIVEPPAPIAAPPAYTAPPAYAAPAAVPSPFAPRQPAAYAPPPPPAQVPPHIAEQVEMRDGSTAVEVTAMFEDAVLEVRHLSNPQGGQITPVTKAILGSAAASLLGLFILFVVSYAQVAALSARREAWDLAGKAYGDFVMPRDGAGRDVAGATLLIYGVGALVLGLFRLVEERRENQFSIGPGRGVTFHAPGEGLPVENFPLVRSTGSDYEFLFSANMSGDVEVGGRSHSLSEISASGQARPTSSPAGAFAMAVPQGARINLRYGDNTFNINSVPRPRRYPVPLAIDWGTQSYTGGVFGAVALFLLLIFSVPPDPRSLSLDAFMNDQRMAKFLVKPEEQKQDEIPDWLKKNKENDGGQRAKEKEGKMGKKDTEKQKNLFALKGPKENVDPALAKAMAADAAKNAGVLGILNAAKTPGMASIFGRDSALGNQADDVLGGLVGTQVGEAFGGGSFGLVGTDRGGGGTGDATIGMGNLGTIGRGSGNPGGGKYGKGVGNLGGHKTVAPDVVPGTAEVKGSLDKELIRRIIRRHINEVKFCYEKELTKNTALQGRVMVQFTIAATGGVISSIVQSSTMGNPNVEQCIAGAVRRWEFPKPQGGIVVVSYPFVLKAAE